MRTLKKIIVFALAIHALLYLFIGDYMLEYELEKEFQEFDQRRLSNKYNDNGDEIWEVFYFSSCGDEFFRTHETLREKINNSNPSRYENRSFLTLNSEYYEDFIDFYNRGIDEDKRQNLIRFGACEIQRIPFLSSKLNLLESFSTHNDFHAMHHNEQILEKQVAYVWILFKWFRTHKEPKE